MAVDEGGRATEKLSKDRRPKTDHFGLFPCTKKKKFTKIAHNFPPFQGHQKTATTGPIRSTFQVVKSGPSEIAESIMQSSSGAWRLGNRETSLLPTDEPGRPPKGKSISGPTYPKPTHKKGKRAAMYLHPPLPSPVKIIRSIAPSNFFMRPLCGAPLGHSSSSSPPYSPARIPYLVLQTGKRPSNLHSPIFVAALTLTVDSLVLHRRLGCQFHGVITVWLYLRSSSEGANSAQRVRYASCCMKFPPI